MNSQQPNSIKQHRHDKPTSGRKQRVALFVVGGVLLLIAIPSIVLTVFIMKQSPLHGVLSDSSIIQGDTEFYHQSRNPLERLTPGNDPKIHAIYQLKTNQYQQLLRSSPALVACQKQPSSCLTPAWQPRKMFVLPNQPDYDSSDLYSYLTLKSLYKQFANDPNTRCTANNTTAHQPTGNGKPNYQLLCANSTLKLLVYEYAPESTTVNPI